MPKNVYAFFAVFCYTTAVFLLTLSIVHESASFFLLGISSIISTVLCIRVYLVKLRKQRQH